MNEDFWDEFETFSDDEAPEFKFNKYGDVIVGKLVHRQILDTRYGRRLKLVLETDEGLRSVWPNQALLRSKLAREKPVTGDKIGIRYTGEDEDSGKGNPTKLFAVKVEHCAPAVVAEDALDGGEEAYGDAGAYDGGEPF